jgi:hypothetical protein
MPDLRVSLDEADFRKLVAGRVVEVEVKHKDVRWWLQIALSDIGFDKMIEAVRDAVDGAGKEVKPDETKPEAGKL